MNAMVKIMNWSKYTIDGWLEQFGAWCETARMRGGGLPDGLHINQIYWLIRENEAVPRSSKSFIRCEISDFEAEQVQGLLRGIFNSELVDYQAKYAVMCLVKHKVENRSLNSVADITKQSKPMAHMMINCGRYFIHSRDLRISIG